MGKPETKTDLRNVNSKNFTLPFIGIKIPFIGYIRPGILPFVGNKLPLIPKRGYQRGFTLVELMVTVFILAILSALSAPAMRDIVMNNRMATETNDLILALTYARSEAVKRSTAIIICKSLDPSAATPTCDTNGANPWTTGWLIFVDANSDSVFKAVDGDELLRLGDGFSGTGTRIKASASIQNIVQYSRMGLLSTTASSFTLCDSRGNQNARVIDISATGRTRINRNVTADCS